MKFRVATAAFGLSLVLTVPALLVDLLLVFNAINPMNLMFVTSFQIRNDSSEHVSVWLAGTGETGELGLLPLYASKTPALPSFQSGGFQLAPATARTITYDWDDTNFELVLVKGADGTLRAMTIDTDDRKDGCCWRHQQDLYVIPPLPELRLATAEERNLVGRRSVWLFIVPCLLMPLVSVFLYRVRRQLGVATEIRDVRH